MGEATVKSITEGMDPARAAALWTLLGSSGPPPEAGDPCPAFFHQIYFWDFAAAEALGRDGHRALGGLIPDLGLPRRMWAGGKLVFHAPLRLGIAAEKTSTVRAVTRKEGRSGRLGFVTIRHQIRQRGATVITEDQDLVYLEANPFAPSDPTPPKIEEEPERVTAFTFDAVYLFRYSALTMNGHRIHYDQAYCGTEGYPGPVVHGPLLAQHLASAAEEKMGNLSSFQFRATAPAFLGDALEICTKGQRFWVRGPDKRLIMTAKAG